MLLSGYESLTNRLAFAILITTLAVITQFISNTLIALTLVVASSPPSLFVALGQNHQRDGFDCTQPHTDGVNITQFPRVSGLCQKPCVTCFFGVWVTCSDGRQRNLIISAPRIGSSSPRTSTEHP